MRPGFWYALGFLVLIVGAAFIAVRTVSREQAERIGSLPVRGTFTCSPPTPASEGVESTPGWLSLDLGIERFYINQADAMRIEQVLSEQRAGEEVRAFAIISVGSDGRARLRALLVDGERFDLSWL